MSVISSSQPRNRAWLPAILFILCSVLFIHSRAYSTNDNSRLASIDSLIVRGTWMIDQSNFSTIDKIKVGDHFYSDKPPILSFLGAGLYSILHSVFGLNLQTDSCDVDRSPTHCRAILEIGQADGAYFMLVFFMMTLPGALIVYLIDQLAYQRGFSPRASSLIALAVGLGTSIWPYTTVFTNHVPSAAALIAAAYILLVHERPLRAQLIAIGFCAALSAAIDLSNAIFMLGFFIYIVWRKRSSAGWLIAGALLPIAITIILDYQIIGSPLPPQTYTAGYSYAGTHLHPNFSGFQSSTDVPRYMFDLLIGQRGMFMYFPIVIWFVIAAVQAARSAESSTRWLSRVALIGCGLYFVYFALSTDNFGGNGYSPRWLLNPAAVLALFAATQPIGRARWRGIILVGLAAYSIFQACIGASNPWTPSLPLLRFDYTAQELPQQPNVVMSGYSSINALPLDLRDLLGTNNPVPRRIDATRSFVIPKGNSWYFIDDSATLAPEIAQPLGLTVPTTLTLQIDLNQTAQTWLGVFSNTIALDSGNAISLPISFNHELALLGYQIRSKPSKLTIITAWSVSASPQYQEQLKAFIDFFGSNGEMLQHTESFGVQYNTLQVGDMIFHVRTFLTSSLPANRSALQIGVVDAETDTRLMTDVGSDHVLVNLNP